MSWLYRLVVVHEDEVRPLLWSCGYVFSLFLAYFVLRPVRDTMAAAGGVRELPWLFTGTLLVILAVHPLQAALVSRLPRRRFVPLAYHFFGLNLVVFYLALRWLPAADQAWVGRAFYVWTSVFNLFVVSVFWSYMADVFRPEQGRRLFGTIAVGATLGAAAGSAVTASLAHLVGEAQLLLVSVVALEIAVLAAAKVAPAAHADQHDAPLGGGALAAFREVARSPYLLGICGFMLLYTVTSTLLYFQKIGIVELAITERAARTAFFARIDLVVNVLTALAQVLLTGRLLRRFGLTAGLVLVPLVTLAGFWLLSTAPTLAVVAGFEIVRRVANYAVTRPSREVLFTVVSRQEKYKAKHLLDTFVYRTGDQIGAWTSAAVTAAGLGVAAIAAVAMPAAAAWLVVAVWLGWRHGRAVTATGGGRSEDDRSRATG